MLKPDICVIGAGSGGLSVAAAAAAFGVPVVLIEKHRMGGDCLNTGCVPSKSLIAAARRAHLVRTSGAFGIEATVTVDFTKVRAHVHEVIAAIAPNDSVERFRGLGVRVIKGEARFVGPKTVRVGDTTIQARRFVIATGSRPALPSIPGLERLPYLTNETVFNLEQCPRHLLVIGAGPIGLELGQAFRRLGAQVTVLEAAAPLAKDDPECASVVLDQLAREGIDIRTGVTIARMDTGPAGVRAVLQMGAGEEAIDASHVLVAAGRRAVVEGLGLDAAGISCGRNGIVVDKGLRTTNRHVYAVGDIAGGPQFTHAANYHAGLVIRNALFRLPVSADDSLIPRVTFTDPELAHAGLTEAQARARHGAVRVARWPYRENDRAQAERETHGHIKVVMSARGRILGATIVGTDAGELISTWALAVERRMNIRAMTGVVVPYPTRAEIGKRAAIDVFARRLTSPLVRRIIGWLRRFG
ncbi:MAG: FAD-dependent oxidoreductase [Pseudorhodoplanes sp.]|nr:FAD-dependent oxidoreductase [Pseudorhodoplanes sp.]GIK79642.1 MAG: dihydrolipoamide dehydrogenase [Alphaproteobacteria bacterium]